MLENVIESGHVRCGCSVEDFSIGTIVSIIDGVKVHFTDGSLAAISMLALHQKQN